MRSLTKKSIYIAIGLTLLVASMAMIASYQATIYLMPTPTVISQGDINPFAINPNLKPDNEIPVLFATNRLPAGPMEDRLYSIFPSDKLRLGLIRMQIGGRDTPWEKVLRLSTTSQGDNRPPLKMRGMREVASYPISGGKNAPVAANQALAHLVNRALEQSIDKDLTIYVHGANTGLYRASAQAAQYRHFTGRNSVVIVFLWPSAENLLGYGTDTRHAGKSAAAFARLLELLAEHTDARNINVLAYSAGAQIVSPALDILGRSTDQSDRKRLRLGQVYFAAGDISVATFVNHLQNYSDMPRATTVAMNRRDSVLALAKWREKVSRVGKPDIADLSDEKSSWVRQAVAGSELSIIEVSSDTVSGLRPRSHDFWFTHPWVSSDILLQFLFQKTPQARGLNKTGQQGSIPLWTFPQNYPEIIGAIVERAVVEQRNAG